MKDLRTFKEPPEETKSHFRDLEQEKEIGRIPKKLLTPRQQRKKGKAFKRGGNY